MYKKTFMLAALAALAAVAVPSGAAETSAHAAMTAMIDRYEAVRTALLNDTLDGVAESARGIETTARELAAGFDPEAAGVPAASAENVAALLPEIAEAAHALAAAEDLRAAREALGELTKPLVRYHKLTGATDVQVAYCPMVKKAWLQKDDETIGNPYYGQEMPGCGSFVGD